MAMALRRKPLSERKAALRKLLFRTKDSIQYVEHAQGHGAEMFAAVCDLGLEGIVSKKIDAPYRSGPSKSWIKVKNPKSPADTSRPAEGTIEPVPQKQSSVSPGIKTIKPESRVR